METTRFNKPDIKMYFASMPFIGRYMQYDYDCADSQVKLIGLFHKWMNEAEATKNLVRRIHFTSSAQLIYKLITGEDYKELKQYSYA